MNKRCIAVDVRTIGHPSRPILTQFRLYAGDYRPRRKDKEVNKKTLQEIYPKNEKDLKNYLKDNKVNFSNEGDLKKADPLF